MSNNFAPDELELIKELETYRDDEVLGVESCIHIVDKKKERHLIKLHDSQKLSINYTGHINYEVKVRQEGRTTLHIARALYRARFRNNFEALILAHEEFAAPVLFDKLKDMDDNLPDAVKGEKERNTTTAIKYKDNKSLVRIATAGASEAVSSKKGRSTTPDWIHITEAAYILYLDVLLQGIIGSMPEHAVLTLESTSNGPSGAFHAGCMNIYNKGEEVVQGRVWVLGDKVLKFSGLLHHEEYRSDAKNYRGPIDEEEERLLSLGALPETIMWRRKKLSDLINDPKRSKALSPVKQFKREWPATFEEAFEESGSNFFNPKIIRLEKEAAKLRNEAQPPVIMGLMRQNGQRPKPVRATEKNTFHIYELPRDGWIGRYLAISDVGAGNPNSDPDSVYVIDRVANKVVAKSYGLLGAMSNAENLVLLAEYYFNAYLGWDATGIGAEVRPYVLESGYPLEMIYHRRRNYSDPEKASDDNWRTDRDGFGLIWGRNRDASLSLVRYGIESRTLTIWDEDFFDECQQFVYDENGKPCASIGYTDDRVMNLAGGCCINEALPAPTKEIPIKEFQNANKLREKINRTIMGRVRGGVVYEGMEN